MSLLMTNIFLVWINYRKSEEIISSPYMVPKFVNFFLFIAVFCLIYDILESYLSIIAFYFVEVNLNFLGKNRNRFVL